MSWGSEPERSVKVLPWSRVRYRYGCMSSSIWASTITYATAGSNGEGSIILIVAHSGRPGRCSVTSVHDLPPSRVGYPAVIRSDPDPPFFPGRFSDGRDRAVVFGARVVARDRTTRPLLSPLVVASQVGADRRPGLAAVGGPEEDVRGVVNHLRIVRRSGDRGRPAESVLHVGRAMARGVVEVAAHRPGLADPVVVPRDDPGVLARVDDVGVGRVGDGVARLAAAHVVPVAQRDPAAAQAVARAGDRAQVLHRAGDVVRIPRVDADPVELADRQRRGVPGLAAVQADVHAAVIPVDHPPGLVGSIQRS